MPPGDESALAAALERLLRDPAERRLSEAGRRCVERYDAPPVAAQFLGAIGLPETPRADCSTAEDSNRLPGAGYSFLQRRCLRRKNPYAQEL